MISVGIIVNPASGKDIRRVVAGGFVVTNQEKVNTVHRLLAAMDRLGVERVLLMPDPSGLSARILADHECEHLQIALVGLDYVLGNADDSRRAAEAMCAEGVACIISLGGDGTNRVVAKGCGETPLVPISTGTNNVFPEMIEGTLAGIAAAAIACGAVTKNTATWQAPMLELLHDGNVIDIALVDLVVLDGLDTGARAVWQTEALREIYLTRSSPNSIGFSSIGGSLVPLEKGCGKALFIKPGANGHSVLAPIAPGLISEIIIEKYRLFEDDEVVELGHSPCVIALDGEREVILSNPGNYGVGLNCKGPIVVDFEPCLKEAAENGFMESNYWQESVLPRRA